MICVVGDFCGYDEVGIKVLSRLKWKGEDTNELWINIRYLCDIKYLKILIDVGYSVFILRTTARIHTSLT